MKQKWNTHMKLSTPDKLSSLLLVVYAFVLTMPTEFFYASERIPRNDTAVYQYIGWIMSKGMVPYVTAFDHKGPLVYLIYAFGYIINPAHGIWVLNFLFMAGILILSYFLVKRFAGTIGSLILCVIVYSDFLNVGFLGSEPEFYAVFFVTGSLLILSNYFLKGDLTKKQCILLGVFGAAIFWLKYTSFVTIAILCFFILIEKIWHKEWHKLFEYLLWFIAGFLCISLVICGWMFLAGAGNSMISDYFKFNLLYAGATRLNRANSFVFIASYSCAVIAYVMTGGSILINIVSNNYKELLTTNKAIGYGFVSLLLTMIVLCMPGYSFAHYATPLFPIVLFIAGAVVKEINTLKYPHIACIKTVATAMAFCLVTVPSFQKFPQLCQKWWTKNSEDTQLLKDISKYASADDKIIVHGFDSYGVYVKSGHEAASKYFFTSSNVEKISGMTEEYRKDIETNCPSVIICLKTDNPYKVFGNEILKNYYLVDNTDTYYVYALQEKTEITNLNQKIAATVDFETYLKTLSQSDCYTIYFAVKDRSGKYISSDALDMLSNIGFHDVSTLNDDAYHTWIGVVQNRQVMYEHIGLDESDQYQTSLGDHEIHIESKTWAMGNLASIKIDDQEYALNRRGINIVVYDNETSEVIDSVCFDTYDMNVPCNRS